MSKLRHAVCLVSGSVDSAVAALLTKRKGFEVTCLFIKNKFQDEDLQARNLERAKKACGLLGLELRELGLHRIQWDNYLQALLASYKKDQVPDSNVVFNQQVIFKTVLDHAFKSLGADAIVTGHYARTSLGDNIFQPHLMHDGSRLMKAVDLVWDQSFLLSQTVQKNIQKTMFPLGDFNRDIVFRIAESTSLKLLCEEENLWHKNRGVHVSEKKILQEIEKQLELKKGKFTLIGSQYDMGQHEGLHRYHIGQQVVIDGTAFYVADKKKDAGDITLTEDPNHPALFCDSMFISLAHWNHDTPYNFFKKQMMEHEFRYGNQRQPVIKCVLTVGMNNEYCGNDHLILSSTKPIRAVSPGSHTALYWGEQCTGGASVLRPGASHYALNYHKYKDLVASNKRAYSNPVLNFFMKKFQF